jgi:hypothetical protein
MWDFQPLLDSNTCSYKCTAISESLCITLVVEVASLNGQSLSKKSNAGATVQANQVATLRNSPVLLPAFFKLIFFGGDGRKENPCQINMYLYCPVVCVVAINMQLSKSVVQ